MARLLADVYFTTLFPGPGPQRVNLFLVHVLRCLVLKNSPRRRPRPSAAAIFPRNRLGMACAETWRRMKPVVQAARARFGDWTRAPGKKPANEIRAYGIPNFV